MHVDVRRLGEGDLDAALAISTAANWNQRQEDWRMLLALAREGALGATHEGRLIATALSIDYGRFGWVAMMLVDPAYRGRGIGARLLQAAVDAVPPLLPVRLDATPLGKPLYERFGFTAERALTRYVRPAGAAAPPPPHMHVVRMDSVHLDEIVRLDEPVFRGGRETVLRWMPCRGPQYACVSETGGRLQYAFGRSGRLFEHIGPIVAEGHPGATALLTAALHASAHHAVIVDAFDDEEAFCASLRRLGFTPQRPLLRMTRRPSSAVPAGDDDGSAGPANGLREYAILGPEFA